ncbi:MAG: TetR/AcrR family transcriptional regulator [Clostridiales bacterium]|nr:TetR/AcrR family transcriptional regulator [Eubacteriales bacterium]MDH7567553.1 TetR/AcrR family transcriptional regulator [Clostridiales bacterium]
MNDRFDNLKEEKRKKIIDVCVEEFAQNGFEKASTNTIVKKAGISKGILFHYFGSKKNLYLYVVDYAIDHFIKEYDASTVNLSSDIFQRFTEISLIKLKMAYGSPVLYKLLLNAFVDMPAEVRDDLQERYDRICRTYVPLILEDIDISGFRKDIDAHRAVEFIYLSLEALSRKYMLELKRGVDETPEYAKKIVEGFSKCTEDLHKCMDMLKYGIYER